MRTQPACLHRDRHKRLVLVVVRDQPGGGRGAKVTGPDGILAEIAGRRDLPRRLKRDSVAQLHDQGPSVMRLADSRRPVNAVDPSHQVFGRASRFLR